MAEAPYFKAKPSQSDASITVAVGGGAGWCEGRGPLYVATEKNSKIAEVHSITLHFGHEDLVKTKLFVKIFEKRKGKAFYYN
jgi:hypothetical protein